MIDTKTIAVLQNPNTGEIIELDLPYSESDLERVLNSFQVDPECDEEEQNDDGSDCIYDMLISGRLAEDSNVNVKFDGEEDEEPKYVVSEYRSDFFDCDDLFDRSLEEVNDIVETVEDFEDYEIDNLKAAMETGESLNDAIRLVSNGEVEFYPDNSLSDVARELYDEGIIENDTILNYIDWDAVGELIENWGYSEVSGGVVRVH